MRRIVLLLVLILIYLSFSNFLSEKSTLERLLSDVDLKVTVKDVVIQIEKGKVKKDDSVSVEALRIAAFYYWNKEDPLFTGPDFDYKALDASIANLDKSQALLLKTVGGEQNVYPIDFLITVSQAAKAYKDFLNDPSYENAETLLRMQSNVVLSYKKDAAALLRKVSASKQESPIFINTRTSTKIIIQDLNTIIKNADSLQNEIDKRKKCLYGQGGCRRPAVSFVKPENIIVASKTSNPELINKDLIFRNPKNVIGPFVVDTPCFGWSSDFSYPDQYFYAQYRVRSGLPFVNIQQATDMYFDRIDPNTQLSYQKKLLSLGVPFVFSTSTAPYKCEDLGYLARVATLSHFMANNKPILQNINFKYSANFWSEAKQSEINFFKEKYPSYQDLSKLASFYGYSYRLMVEHNDASDIREELLRRKLGIERSLSDFNLVLNYISGYVQERYEFEKSEAISNPKFSENYVIPQFIGVDLYTFRSYYGIMYLPFSLSFWRLEQSPQYLDKIIVENALNINSDYVNYKSAIKKYSLDEIKRWLINRLNLYNEDY